MSWKEGGKTVSRRLSPEHTAFYREWIANRRQFDALVKQLHDVSRSARQHLLDAADDTTTPAATKPPDKPSRRR